MICDAPLIVTATRRLARSDGLIYDFIVQLQRYAAARAGRRPHFVVLHSQPGRTSQSI